MAPSAGAIVKCLTKEMAYTIVDLSAQGYTPVRIQRKLLCDLSDIYDVLGTVEDVVVIDDTSVMIHYPDATKDPVRCPGCGAKVHPPCLRCQLLA